MMDTVDRFVVIFILFGLWFVSNEHLDKTEANIISACKESLPEESHP